MSTSPVPTPSTEPWLRGTHSDIPAVGRAVFHALELAFEDIRKWTAGLTNDEMRAEPFGLVSIAVQLGHIAGSVDRILTYAEGNRLSEKQLTALQEESAGKESLPDLLARVETSFARVASRIQALAGTDLERPRAVGRQQLPTTVGGAMVHVADHTQRHVGQIITTAKVLKALRG